MQGAPDPAAALVPGLTLCGDCRSRDAVLTSDPGERWERPLCFQCAEDEIERMCTPRETYEMIVRAREDPRYRPLPPPPVDLATADHSKLNALRAQWLAFESRMVDGARCWAMVATGRCVRAEAREGLCETHLAVGASVPGLGWLGDVPQGPIVARRGRSAA